MKLSKILAAFLAAFILAGVAGAQTYYVDSAAPAGGDGLTEATAFDNVEDIDAVTSDDSFQEIRLKRGSNFQDQTLTFANNMKVTTYGSGAKPIIDHNGTGRTTILTDPVNVFAEGFVVREADFHGIRVEGHADNVTFYRIDMISNGGNGFAHEFTTGSTPVASGRVTLIECRAEENGVDGFNNRGFASDLLIRCAAIGHDNSGGSDDGYTTHDSSSMECWYCTSEGDEDGFHFTGTPAAGTYNKIVGCEVRNTNGGLAFNLTTALLSDFRGNRVYDTSGNGLDWNATGGNVLVVDQCEFYRCGGSAIDLGGTGSAIVANSIIVFDADPTAGSIYGVRSTASSSTILYNSTIVLPAAVGETTNMFGFYASSGVITLNNNLFTGSDEGSGYYVRITDATTNLFESDNNTFKDTGSEDLRWWNDDLVGSEEINFAAWQAYNKGNGGGTTDDDGGGYTEEKVIRGDPTTDVDAPNVEDYFAPRFASFETKGKVLASLIRTGYGNRLRSTLAPWCVGPGVFDRGGAGVFDNGRGRITFANFPLEATTGAGQNIRINRNSILGNLDSWIELKASDLMTTVSGASLGSGFMIHTGIYPDSAGVLYSGFMGASAAFTPIDIEAPPGEDVYVTFFGTTGSVFGAFDFKVNSGSPSASSRSMRPLRKHVAENR